MQEGRFFVMKRSLPKPLRGRGCIPPKRFFLSKRASPSCKKGVSLPRREPFLVLKKRPLCFQTLVFTPLSIRRGVGGEAVVGRLLGFFLPLNEPYKRLHLRLLYTRQHQFYPPHDRSHTPFSILLSHHPLA